MNRLRALALANAALLGAFVCWAFLAYDGLARPVPYAVTAAVAVSIPLLPRGAAHAKLAGLRLVRRLRGGTEFSDERGTVFRASTPLERVDVFDAVERIVADLPAFDATRTAEFPEGTGLVVTYSGFHSLSVRVTDEGYPVVTGASDRSRELADRLDRACSLSFERVESSPFLGPQPLRGGPRVLLAGVLVLATAGGALVVSDAAYPSTTYNTAEKGALVAMDARVALDPDASETDLQLQKAAFLVSSIREEAVEIRWANGSGEQVRSNAVQALETDAEVRRLLRSARSGSLSDEQATRADRIEGDLREADRRVAATIANRTATDVADPDGELAALRERLHNASQTSVETTEK